MATLKQLWEVLYRLKNGVGVPASGTLCSEVEAAATAVSAIPTTDHFAVLSELGPITITAGSDTYQDIPVGAKSYSITSSNAARTGSITGYAAPSDNPRTKTGPITTLSDAGPIPLKMDDDSTAPDHIYAKNTDSVTGYIWIQFYK